MSWASVTIALNDSVSNTGNNAWSLGTYAANLVLTGVDVIGGYAFDAVAGIPYLSRLETFITHGLQIGPHGYTPVGVVGSPDNADYFFVEMVEPNSGASVFPDESASNNAYTERYAFALRWRGQKPITQQSDLYYSEGSTLGSGVTKWQLFARARVYVDSLS